MLPTMGSTIRGPLARVIVLAVVASLAALLPLCHASAPDPTWIAGMWDDADHDDVVLAALGTVAVADDAPSPLPPVRHAPRSSESIGRQIVRKPERLTQLDRAPPHA
jgi:hypothetical protein